MAAENLLVKFKLMVILRMLYYSSVIIYFAAFIIRVKCYSSWLCNYDTIRGNTSTYCCICIGTTMGHGRDMRCINAWVCIYRSGTSGGKAQLQRDDFSQQNSIVITVDSIVN